MLSMCSLKKLTFLVAVFCGCPSTTGFVIFGFLCICPQMNRKFYTPFVFFLVWVICCICSCKIGTIDESSHPPVTFMLMVSTSSLFHR